MQRHWHMLRLVPRAPRKVDAATLQSQLEARGFYVDRRSIQRDLVKLSGHFALVVDERSKPFGWSWALDATPFDIPGMDLHTALAFNLAGEHLNRLLPHATFDHLRPHFERARHVLDNLSNNELADWRSSVRVLPSGQPMAPPEIDPDILEAVHDGLLHRRQLQVTYQPRGKFEAKTYTANPLALVYRDKIAYLVCALFDYDNCVQLAVHRLHAISQTGEPVRVPPSWQLDAYIEAGEFGVRMGKAPLQLVLRLRETVLVGLIETPLSTDQEFEPCGVIPYPQWSTLRATVADTAQLRTWLRSHGSACEVMAPAHLRLEFAEEAQATAKLYEGE